MITSIDKDSEFQEPDWIFKSIAWVSVFFSTFPLVATRFIHNKEINKNNLAIGANYLFGLLTVLLILSAIFLKKYYKKLKFENCGILHLTIILFILSFVFNLSSPRPMSIFSIICIYWIWGLSPVAPKSLNPIFLILPILFFIIPSIIIELTFGPISDFYLSGSFRGFFESRTDHAFLTGIALLVILLTNNKNLLIILIPLLATCIALSGSRSGILATTAALTFAAITNGQSKRFERLIIIIPCITWIWVASWVLKYFGHWNKNPIQIRLINFFPNSSVFKIQSNMDSEKIGIFGNTGGRIEIYQRTIEEIINSPFWGKGSFFQQININGFQVEAHNNILQSILNFGIFATSFWLILLFIHFKRINFSGQALIIYWFVFGFFQPGFDAFLFVPITILVFILSICLKDANLT